MRETGDWEAWLEFFLTGVIETSTEAVETARQLLTLFQEHRTLLDSQAASDMSFL